MTFSLPTTFIGRTDTPSIPTIVVGQGIPTKLVGTVYFGKSCYHTYLSDAALQLWLVV